MKKIDLYLQNKRLQKTEPYISSGKTVLDIGSNNGDLFTYYIKKGIQIQGIGIDPNCIEEKQHETFSLVRDYFPSLKVTGKFDVITILAVIEHIPEKEMGTFIQACKDSLNEGGVIIITVPHPFVDIILHVLGWLKLIDGMETDQHYGLKISTMKKLFQQNGLQLLRHTYFQFGLNNLFIFKK